MKKLIIPIYPFEELTPAAQQRAIALERERISEQLDNVVTAKIESILGKHGYSFTTASWDQEGSFSFEWILSRDEQIAICQRLGGFELQQPLERFTIEFVNCVPEANIVGLPAMTALQLGDAIFDELCMAAKEVVAMLGKEVPDIYGSDSLVSNIEAAGVRFFEDGTHFMPPPGLLFEEVQP